MNNTIVWLKDPKILLNKKYVKIIWPKKDFTPEQKLNAITRLIIILVLLGYLITGNWKIIVLGIIALLLFVFLYNTRNNKKDKAKSLKEKFGMKGKEAFTNPDTYKKYKGEFTNPTEKNPVMNVLLPEIKYDPKRKQAAPAYNPIVEKEINKSTVDFVGSTLGGNDVDKKLFTSLGDSFEFEVGAMNRFYANPATTIPNDQGGFADYCYGSMISCKDGDDLACARDAPRLGSIMN